MTNPSETAKSVEKAVPQAAEPVLAEIEKRFGCVPEVFQSMAFAPDVLESVFRLSQALQSDLPPRYRELAYLKASRLNGSERCEEFHGRLAESVGVTESQLEALDDFEESDAFDDREKAVLRFAELLTRCVSVPLETREELAEFLSESQRVVLAATIGLANFSNRFNRGLDVEF